jgi:hypothetical protein
MDEKKPCVHGRVLDGRILQFAGAIYQCQCCKNPYGTLNATKPEDRYCDTCRPK